MGIYTKTGDQGMTSLYTGERVEKYSLQVDAYGTLDELSAQLSVAEKWCEEQSSRDLLIWIIQKIFLLNAELASNDSNQLKQNSELITIKEIELLEERIDGYMDQTGSVDFFILPGKTMASAQLHLARCVCRRAERRIVELELQKEIRKEVIAFMNRLSDLLYSLARYEDHIATEKQMIASVIERYQAENQEKQSGNTTLDFFRLVDEAVSQAEEMGLAIAIHLLDYAGEVVGSYRMPDALLVASEISYKKAYTAFAMKMSTKDLSELVQPGADFYQLETSCEGKLVSFSGGGLLLDEQQRISGAVGISGGTLAEDQLILEKVIDCWRDVSNGNNK